jgi:hypothetical protein
MGRGWLYVEMLFVPERLRDQGWPAACWLIKRFDAKADPAV